MKLRGGEEIVITGEVELPPLRAFAEDIPLDVIYEDDSIAVVNKAAGMSVHAGSGKGEAGKRGTMVNALLHRFNQLSEIGGELRPGSASSTGRRRRPPDPKPGPRPKNPSKPFDS